MLHWQMIADTRAKDITAVNEKDLRIAYL